MVVLQWGAGQIQTGYQESLVAWQREGREAKMICHGLAMVGRILMKGENTSRNTRSEFPVIHEPKLRFMNRLF